MTVLPEYCIFFGRGLKEQSAGVKMGLGLLRTRYWGTGTWYVSTGDTEVREAGSDSLEAKAKEPKWLAAEDFRRLMLAVAEEVKFPLNRAMCSIFTTTDGNQR